MGRAERRPPGRLQARLGRPRSGRSLPQERRAARTPAQGRGRVPRVGHHGQPRRQGTHPRNPRAESSVTRTLNGLRRRRPAARPVASRVVRLLVIRSASYSALYARRL